MDSLTVSTRERAQLAEVQVARISLKQLNAEIVKLALESRTTEATDLILNKSGTATSNLMSKLALLQDTGTQEAYEAASAARHIPARRRK